MYKVEDFYSGKETARILKVSQQTLRLWSNSGKIEMYRTPGNVRKYNLTKYMQDNNLVMEEEEPEEEEKVEKLIIGYIRVSSQSQTDDLGRQRVELQSYYPGIEIIEDVGSGVHLTKRGIKKIVNLAIQGRIDKLIVLYKDRLTRFGYDLIEYLIQEYSNGEIVIVHKKENESPEEELSKDIINILNVYTAKLNGVGKYNNHKEAINK